MGAAENGAGEILRGPAGALGARAGRKMRHRRPHCGLYVCHGLSFPIEAPRWGGAGGGLRPRGEFGGGSNIARAGPVTMRSFIALPRGFSAAPSTTLRVVRLPRFTGAERKAGIARPEIVLK